MRRAEPPRVQTYSAQRAMAELEAQHKMLRGMMARCEALADELDAGRCGPLQLTREVARLRLAFEAHNKFEEEMLRPVLMAGLDAATLDDQVDEHINAHRAMRLGLASNETAMLREVIESMRAHLEGEEHYLFSARRIRAMATTAG